MLLMASVSFCRADSSPPTREPKKDIVATFVYEYNAPAFDQTKLAKENQITIENDAKPFTLSGVWNLPAEKATYVVVGQVPVPSWRSNSNLYLSIHGAV